MQEPAKPWNPDAGEAFDKTARMLGLPLEPSGGAAVEAFAREGDPHACKFAVPLARREDCNFSYAGVKTAVLLAVQRIPQDLDAAATEQVCACLCNWLALHSPGPSLHYAASCKISAFLQCCGQLSLKCIWPVTNLMACLSDFYLVKHGCAADPAASQMQLMWPADPYFSSIPVKTCSRPTCSHFGLEVALGRGRNMHSFARHRHEWRHSVQSWALLGS